MARRRSWPDLSTRPMASSPPKQARSIKKLPQSPNGLPQLEHLTQTGKGKKLWDAQLPSRYRGPNTVAVAEVGFLDPRAACNIKTTIPKTKNVIRTAITSHKPETSDIRTPPQVRCTSLDYTHRTGDHRGLTKFLMKWRVAKALRVMPQIRNYSNHVNLDQHFILVSKSLSFYTRNSNFLFRVLNGTRGR